MSAATVRCRPGDPLEFTVHITDEGGLPARYTAARFQMRAAWDDTTAPLLAADQDSGVTFDHDNASVLVAIGATATGAIPTVRKAAEVPAQLRLYDPANPDDTLSFVIPLTLQPDGIDDAV